MQAIKQTYLLLSANEYRIQDEQTGSINEGVSIQYIPDDNLDPVIETAQDGQYVRGKKVAKMSLPLSVLFKLGSFPGLYDVKLEMRVVSAKTQLRAIDLDFVSEVKLQAVSKQNKAS